MQEEVAVSRPVCLPCSDLWGSLWFKLEVVDRLCLVGLLRNVGGCRDGSPPEEYLCFGDGWI
jgi:hypothetical protein